MLASATLCHAQSPYPTKPITLLVPWVAGGCSAVALRGGHVQVQADTSTWKMVDAGQIRPLVMWSSERSARVPNLPTLKELYGIVANSPWGIGGPKGMDPKVVKLLHDAFKRTAEEPAFVKLLDRLTMEPYYMAGEDYMKWVRRAAEEEKRAVEHLGLNK